jgi:hypothetical protein
MVRPTAGTDRRLTVAAGVQPQTVKDVDRRLPRVRIKPIPSCHLSFTVDRFGDPLPRAQ